MELSASLIFIRVVGRWSAIRYPWPLPAEVVMPILITVLFGSVEKTPARSQAIWISSSVRPLDRRNFCFCCRGLRTTFAFWRKFTAVAICRRKANQTDLSNLVLRLRWSWRGYSLEPLVEALEAMQEIRRSYRPCPYLTCRFLYSPEFC